MFSHLREDLTIQSSEKSVDELFRLSSTLLVSSTRDAFQENNAFASDDDENAKTIMQLIDV